MERKTGFRRSRSARSGPPVPVVSVPGQSRFRSPARLSVTRAVYLLKELAGFLGVLCVRAHACGCMCTRVRVCGCVFSPPLGGAVSSVALPFVPPVRWKPDRVAGPGSGLVTWRRCSGCRAPSWPRRQWAGGGVFPRCH